MQEPGLPGREIGAGWSASYRKSYLSAIKFLYRHFFADEELPDLNPAALESSPKIIHKRGYTPSRNDIKKLLDAPGTPRARLLAYWMFYAPSRRKTFSDARWPDLDLEQGTWEVVGKGDVVDVFALAPPLLRQLRLYRRWQLAEAEQNPAMRDALSDPETAYVAAVVPDAAVRLWQRGARCELARQLRPELGDLPVIIKFLE